MVRNTQQKEAIKSYLKSVKTHPTADLVYSEVRKQLPKISKATVYRVLNKLVNDGGAQEISADVCRYDGEVDQHAHFICRKCGLITDILDKSAKISFNKENDFGSIDGFQLSFYGKCNSC